MTQTTLPKFTIIVKDPSGNVVANLATFRRMKFGKRLNNYGKCEFEIPANQSLAGDIIDLRKNTIEIYEHTFSPLSYLLKEDGDYLLKEDGGRFVLEDSGHAKKKVWAGEMALAEGRLNSKRNNWITLYCYTWFEQLRHRYTEDEVIYDGVDAGAIAWDLINDTQSQTNGDFGITQGTIEATTSRDRTYYNDNIMESIINLANVLSGFDFEINDNRVFTVYALKGTDLSGSLILEYGKNILSCNVMQNFVDPINRAIILGEATGENTLQRVERNDATQQAAYKVREMMTSEMTVSELNSLQDKGDALLRKYDTPLLQIDMQLVPNSIKITDFALGDVITLRIQDGYYNINEDYRIYEWELEYNSDEKQILSLVLGKFIL